MSAARILVVYGTSHGQTAKVASHVADRLTAAGCEVTLANVDAPPNGLSLHAFTGVIVGSPILYGRHLRRVRRFVRAHRDALNAVPSAFVSVSGSAASQLESERAKARECVGQFLDETGWHPTYTETIGGALAYTKYGPVLRWLARRGAEKAGGPTDTSRDHEFTDWARVDRFAATFAAAVSRSTHPRPLVPA